MKIPDFKAPEGAASLHCPALSLVDEVKQESKDYMMDPTNPVLCPADVRPEHAQYRDVESECTHGEPGSTVNFWRMSNHESRITLGFRMHPTAAFLSMPNERGVIKTGTSSKGFNDHSERGYPLFLTLSTRQVSDVVRYDEKTLETKRTTLPLDAQG